MVRDPVCLMELEPRAAAAMASHQGRAYYFCSAGCKQKFIARPELFLDKAPGMRLAVGVMGSASHDVPPQAADAAYRLGQAIARHGFIVITGACPGLPHACARGARDAGPSCR